MNAYTDLTKIQGLQLRFNPREWDWPACKETGNTARVTGVTLIATDKGHGCIAGLHMVTEGCGYRLELSMMADDLPTYLRAHDTGATRLLRS